MADPEFQDHVISNAILYDKDEVSMAVGDTETLPAGTRGFVTVGLDGTTARIFRVDSSGRQILVGAGTAGSPVGGVVSVQGVPSGTEMPVSAASLPLPTGAATEVTLATLATEVTLAAVLVDTGQIEALLTTIDADTSVLAAVDYSTQTTLAAADAKLATIDAVLDSIKDTDGIKKITDSLPAGTNILGEVGIDLPRLEHQLPDPDSFDLNARGTPHVDNQNRLVTKSQVSSDEGAYRDDFDVALESSLTGTYTFSASKVVTGSGTAFTTELTKDSVIRLTSDAQNVAVKIAQVFSDTSLELEEAYTGTASSGAATVSNWKIDAGTGMTISQAASNMTLASGTTISSESHVSRIFEGPGDVGALLSVSQRIANQELLLGVIGKAGSSSEAVFVFDGILNNKVTMRTTSPGGEPKTTTFTFPVGEDTSTQHEYKVEVGHEMVRFFVDSAQAGDHKFHKPAPYERMGAGAHVVNTGTPASSTDFVIDSLFIAQKTVIEVKVSGALDNLRVDSTGNLQVNIAISSQALPLLVNPNFEASDGAVVAQQYKRVLEYTIPDDYDGWLIRYSSFQNETAKSRLVAVTEMGSYDFTPETFTPGTFYVLPQWAAVVEAEVTTQTGSSGAGTVVVTVTYTNELGVGSRTGTFSIPKNSIVGSRFRLSLQSGDTGVSSIEAVSDDGVEVGTIDILGFIQLAYHNDLSNTIQLETNYQPGAIAFPTGTVLAVEYQGGGVSKDRLFDMLIQLVAVPPE